MKNFEYAQARDEREAVELVSAADKQVAVLAGGTDLVGLIKRGAESPDRVVNILEVPSFQSIQVDDSGHVWVGAAVSLGTFLDDSQTDIYPAAKQIIQGISSPQLQSQGTLIGELLRRPACWYYRNGHGLMADQGKRVVEGDNRYHAFLGNRGPAKYVNASRLAPALIAQDAHLRIVGPKSDMETFIPLAELYQIPEDETQGETMLAAGQLITHVIIPPADQGLSAAYEVRQGAGPDQPLAAAAVNLHISAGVVDSALIVLGQAAPTPWICSDAALALQGQEVNQQTAAIAGREAVVGARPLSMNEYKIQLAQVAVKRALLRAVGQETGDLDCQLSDTTSC